MMALLLWYVDPASPHQLKKKVKVKVGPPLTYLSGSAHGCTSKSCIFEKIYISVFSICTPVTLRMQKASYRFCCTTFLDEFPCR